MLIFLKVKSLVEEKSGKKFTLFRAYTYATQVVAGTNYFIKVRHTLRAWLQAYAQKLALEEHRENWPESYATFTTEDVKNIVEMS